MVAGFFGLRETMSWVNWMVLSKPENVTENAGFVDTCGTLIFIMTRSRWTWSHIEEAVAPFDPGISGFGYPSFKKLL